MEIISDPQQMQQQALAARRQGQRIAFVPTMGYLHEGHLSLLHEGRKRGDLLVLSIFVNPTQFGPNEDLDSYPRDVEHDTQLAKEAGGDLIYLPDNASMYPNGYSTWVEVDEGLTNTLCGKSRPGHFRGVTTVVSKLFQIVQPDVALFGSKDFQQLAIIRRMTLDLNMPVEIVGMPIVREADGLAMSSRNVYLDADQRKRALALIEALRLACHLVAHGEQSVATLIDAVRDRILQEQGAEIDYIQVCHQQTLADMEKVDRHAVMLLAVRFGKTRLIDNHHLVEEN
ncbi:MAG: pantoate--beta-alanine ligase [Desulfuromonas sp.]|nr:MAG: pantoate--beta-alanine ligase [Desulfuromonas sp.]